jgi:hypothetical protein
MNDETVNGRDMGNQPIDSLAYPRHVLPKEGFLIALAKKGEQRRQKVFDSIEAMLEWQHRYDAAGWDVYTAYSSFVDPRGTWNEKAGKFEKPRGQDNVKWVGALWLDIDTQESHPDVVYTNREQARKALEAFCQNAGLPLPLIVSSGGGLYAIWPLAKLLPLIEWKELADGLKAACVKFGLAADPARTSDGSSVLRTPGMHHHRTGRIVEVITELVGPYPVEQFEHLKKFVVERRAPIAKAAGNVEDPFGETPKNIATIITAIKFINPSYFWGRPEDYPDVDLSKVDPAQIPGWFHGLCMIGSLPFSQEIKNALAISWSKLTTRGNYAGDAETLHKLNVDIDEREGGITYKSALKWARIRGWDGRPDPAVLAALIAAYPAGEAPDAHSQPMPSSGDAELDAEIERLAGLAPILYERERKTIAEKFGMRTGVLDRLVNAARESGFVGAETQGQAIRLIEPEPWHEAVDGEQLLYDLGKAFLRYVVMTEDDALTVALWILHSYVFDIFLCTPRLCVTSPERGCGKTTTVDLIERLVNRPLSAVNITPSAIFRTIELVKPTILLDEADNMFGKSAGSASENAREILTILNSGHRFGDQTVRNVPVGDGYEPRAFRTHCPVVIALIGKLPETLEDRSIHVRLRRKHVGERVERFRLDQTDDLLQLARYTRRWTDDHRAELAAQDPAMPDALFNRAADNWRPLLAVADVIGGSWPRIAREVAARFAETRNDRWPAGHAVGRHPGDIPDQEYRPPLVGPDRC